MSRLVTLERYMNTVGSMISYPDRVVDCISHANHTAHRHMKKGHDYADRCPVEQYYPADCNECPMDKKNSFNALMEDICPD